MLHHHLICTLLLSVFTMNSCQVTAASSTTTTTTTSADIDKSTIQLALDTKIVFSDVDGTLVHYPETVPEDDDNILALPPSSTGMRAIISKETLCKCREIRSNGRKLVLVSGMRTSTLLNRLPYLPRADAYCSEAGGRIFYPTDDVSQVRIEPVPFEDATADDLKPFGLREDLEWRKNIEDSAGIDGFVGQELGSKGSQSVVPVSLRKGPLWEYARLLQSRGIVLDTKGYATSFRVTAKQQSESSVDSFRELQDNQIPCPTQVTTRTNLGSMDYYPSKSGKKNCCEYLAMKLKGCKLSDHAVCMGDDDNDIEMALACRHAFIPTVTSETMTKTISKHPDQFTAIRGANDTLATEKAIEEMLRMLRKEETSAGQ